MPIQAVFFDLDGTLVDSNDQHVRAWDEAFQEIGVHFPAAAIHAQIGKGKDMLIPALLPALDADRAEALGTRAGEIFKSRYMHGIRPFPGARALLERVHEAGQKIVLATSASAEERDHYVELLGAGDLLSASTNADDVAHTKPAPDIFAAALGKVPPLGPSEVIVVGDTPYDVEAAARCGIAAVGLLSGGFARGILEQAGALRIYDDASDLLRHYDRSPLCVRAAARPAGGAG